MRIKLGTNRMVVEGRDCVYKLPIGIRGIAANTAEYRNAACNPLVAKTEKRWYGLKQERLYDTVILPYEETGVCLPAEWRELWNMKLHNRFQVGRDKHGVWKFFDYEDVKWDGENQTLF